jgi:polyhydroxybutyrate depolymerase
MPVVDSADPTRVTETRYGGCRDGAEVVLYSIRGGGHTWPGGPQYLPAFIIGKTSRQIDATSVIWSFFEAHPKPAGGQGRR